MLLLVLQIVELWTGQVATDHGLLASITFRAAAAAVTAFVLAVVCGGRVIRWLGRRFCEPIVSPSATLEELHRPKQGTPTMGGLLIIGASLISVLFWAELSNALLLAGVLYYAALGVVGAVDDLRKLAGRRGLAEREKLLAQLLLSVALLLFLYTAGEHGGWQPRFYVPVVDVALPVGLWGVPWFLLVLLGATNAVNLTDGLDGLAAGCYVFAGAAVGVVVYAASHAVLADHFGLPHVPAAGEVTVLVGAAVGASLGFLWYNCHPAEVFMGDTGALALGGLLAYAAVIAHQELLMALACGVYVAEAASVLLQRAYYRRTGKRLFRCAPLHHHFQFLGWPENRIVVRFWIVAAICALASTAVLRL